MGALKSWLKMNPARLPVEYIYLDAPGIESLYAQLVDTVETSRTTTTQKRVAAKVGAGLRLKNLLLKAISGLEGEVSGEVTGSRVRTEQSTGVVAIEHRLHKLIDVLSASGADYFFTTLNDAAEHLKTGHGPTFIKIHENSMPLSSLGARWVATRLTPSAT